MGSGHRIVVTDEPWFDRSMGFGCYHPELPVADHRVRLTTNR